MTAGGGCGTRGNHLLGPRVVARVRPRLVGALLSVLVAHAACAPAPTPPAPSTVGNRAAPTPARVTPTPVVTRPAMDPACPLGWDELAEAAPPTIALTATLPDGDAGDACPGDFGAAARAGCPDCVVGRMGGDRATLQIDGPAGSGRFYNLGLVVDGPRPMYACVMASTVAWRHLVEVADRLAPLPWLADLDGDGDAELITWHRLPWGGSEFANALVPVVYVRAGDVLVRRDDRGRALATRVADAYRALAARGTPGPEPACQRAITTALDAWGR